MAHLEIRSNTFDSTLYKRQKRVHSYVGMTLDFTLDKVVKVSMVSYVRSKRSSKLGTRPVKNPMMVSNM